MKAVNVFGLPGGQNLIYPKPAAQLTRPEAIARVNHDKLDPTPEGVTANSTAKAKKKPPLMGVQPKHATEQRGGMPPIPPLHQGTYSEQSAGYKLAVRYAKDLEGMDKEAIAPLVAAARWAPTVASAGGKLWRGTKSLFGGAKAVGKAVGKSSPGRVAGQTLAGNFLGAGADSVYEFATGEDSNGRFQALGTAGGLGRGLTTGTRLGSRLLTRAIGPQGAKYVSGLGKGAVGTKVRGQLNTAATLGYAGGLQESHIGWNNAKPIQTARRLQADLGGKMESQLIDRMGLHGREELYAALEGAGGFIRSMRPPVAQ